MTREAEGDCRRLRQNASTSVASSTARSVSSAARRMSAREGIHDDVDREPGVVHGEEALVLGVVVPLRAVILVAEEQHEPPLVLHTRERLMDEVVAPAVQFVARGRRAVLEHEERAIERMCLRQRLQRPVDARALLRRRLLEYP